MYPPPQYGYAPPPQYGYAPLPPRRGCSPVLAAVAALLFGALVVAAAILHRREVAEFGPVTAACAGTAVPGTRAYVPGQPHRLVGARMDGSGWTPDFPRVPADLRASEASNADVVMCFGDEVTQTLETCTYDVYFRGRTSVRNYPRTVTRLPVRLVAASTGQPLAQEVVQGVVPPACDSQTSSASSTPSAFHVQGASVGLAEIQAWLQSPASPLR
jgi:hypothetical protein